jgi:hypothetical protein
MTFDAGGAVWKAWEAFFALICKFSDVCRVAMAIPLDFSLFLIKNQSMETVCSSLERGKTKTKWYYLNVDGWKDNNALEKNICVLPRKLI